MGKENGKKPRKKQVRDSGAKGSGLGHHTDTELCPNKSPLCPQRQCFSPFLSFPTLAPTELCPQAEVFKV